MNNHFFTAVHFARPATRTRFFNSSSRLLRSPTLPQQPYPTTAAFPIHPLRIAALGVITGITAASLSVILPTFNLDAPVGSYPLQTTHTIITPPPGSPRPALVKTNNSTVPTIPLTINIKDTEYTLAGFGVRTVSFLSIQVYVGAFYIATTDLPKLLAFLIHHVNPNASTLLPSERDALGAALLGASTSEDIWDAVLKDGTIKSAFRIAPVRDTNFHHLRDGFVRAIQARTCPGSREDWVFRDDGFGEAMAQFRNIFSRGKVPKKKELVMVREEKGVLRVLYNDGMTTGERLDLGTVGDERVSRMLWLNWLGGKTVASEAARKSIVEGLLDLAARPLGTVQSIY